MSFVAKAAELQVQAQVQVQARGKISVTYLVLFRCQLLLLPAASCQQLKLSWPLGVVLAAAVDGKKAVQSNFKSQYLMLILIRIK